MKKTRGWPQREPFKINNERIDAHRGFVDLDRFGYADTAIG